MIYFEKMFMTVTSALAIISEAALTLQCALIRTWSECCMHWLFNR